MERVSNRRYTKEFREEAVKMAMGGTCRITLCQNALFTGAWTAIVNPDKTTLDYVKARTKEPFEPLVSDPDAKFAKVYDFDVSRLEPQVVPPPKRDTAKPISEMLGLKKLKVLTS
jgi:3-isopropylmalate/(R)-2-methylmalate dehydratase large subunit